MRPISVKAAILDMDGVITQTATLHAHAWKSMFDAFLKHYAKSHGNTYSSFSIEKDYPRYIDGIPRYEGVKNFLQSRNISLPRGNEDEAPGFDSVAALGNLKNQRFHEVMEEKGVQVFQKNLDAIRDWKRQGLALAIISSSNNAELVLEKAQISDLFDTRIDGRVAAANDLKGKPAPDIFETAAQSFFLKPSDCLAVEDAPMGIEAACKADMAKVIGFSENESARASLKDKGAHRVVESLADLKVCLRQDDIHSIPNAQDSFDQLARYLKKRESIIFLDYDGTLTPIVEDHTEAHLSARMHEIIKKLAGYCKVGVISGRGLKDVKNRVDIPGLFYAGSHGFELEEPDGSSHHLQEAEDYLEALDAAEKELNKQLSQLTGVQVERKKYAIAIHYRKAGAEEEEAIGKCVDSIIEKEAKLEKKGGKKIVELKPAMEWHKGKAIQFLLEEMHTDDASYLPIYLGDDITDEDAFKGINGKGIGILVGEHGEKTYARFRLHDVDEVFTYLDNMIETLSQ